MPEHNAITDPDLHEPKGAAAAANRKIYVADGATSGAFFKSTREGFWDYNDLATATTPLALSTAGTFFNLPNDEAGAFTLKTFKSPGLTDIWKVGTQRFDFTELELGDTVDIRIDLVVTTTGANHQVEMEWLLGEGASPFGLNIHTQNFKSAGTFPIVRWFSIYMGDTNTNDNPAVLRIKTDTGTTDTVQVNGWYVRTQTHAEY